MPEIKKITQNVNKDAGLLKMPDVNVPTSKWISKHANYISSNAGDIVPVYCEEVVPKEKRKVTMAMLSHMTTPKSPLLNAMYTELRAFFVPHRISADLLGGYSTRRSPWVKVFGEDPSSENADIIVEIEDQKLPDVGLNASTKFLNASFKPFGGIADALDMQFDDSMTTDQKKEFISNLNFLSLSAYELIYQYCYRNQNRESATESNLYKFLLNAYNRYSGTTDFDDSFHVANREKDYFTGAQPFTQKGSPVSAPLAGEADLIAGDLYRLKDKDGNDSSLKLGKINLSNEVEGVEGALGGNHTLSKGVIGATGAATPAYSDLVKALNLKVDLRSATGISIEELRLYIKTQEALEKDMMYGNDYASYLNAHFGVQILKGFLDEPQEIRKMIVTTQMQAVLQSSTTDNEPSILGTIGANSTTQSEDLEIVPETFFPEYGYLIICAVHKTQNVYDSYYYKPKHIFKKYRFDYYATEIEDLGYQKVDGLEFAFGTNGRSSVGFNEAFAEYRFPYNKCHGMLQPSRSGSLNYWTTAVSNYTDIESLYKQGKSEVDRAISVTSEVAPQFFDAFGFIEVNEKPMKLHSIPGMDAVI